MKITEIFTSIQGESTYAGLPCTFIRLSGCNLRCSYCDTQYSWEGGEELSVDEIIAKVTRSDVKLVEVTGGEPLISPETPQLITALLSEGYSVLIETNGTMPIDTVDPRAIIIMDIKTPASGMSGKTKMENIPLLKPTDEVKFVISNEDDYNWSRAFIKEHSLSDKSIVLFSPVYGTIEPSSLAEWIVRDNLQVRLNLQLHKYMYSPDKRGV